MIGENLGRDLGINVPSDEWISSLGGKKEVHGFSELGVPSSPISFSPGISVLLSDMPCCASLGSKDLLIDGGEVGPVIGWPMGVEGVEGSSRPSMVVDIPGLFAREV